MDLWIKRKSAVICAAVKGLREGRTDVRAEASGFNLVADAQYQTW